MHLPRVLLAIVTTLHDPLRGTRAYFTSQGAGRSREAIWPHRVETKRLPAIDRQVLCLMRARKRVQSKGISKQVLPFCRHLRSFGWAAGH